MPFGYYRHLTAAQKRIYRESDAIGSIPLPGAAELRPVAEALAQALEAGDRVRTEEETNRLLAGIARRFGVPRLTAQVLARRPSRDWGELHGLYTPGPGGAPARVTLWMRTAQRQQVVKFRTFLRTLLHELCHHLDYELLGLQDSFHTEGFYKRESSLFRQLLGEVAERRSEDG